MNCFSVTITFNEVYSRVKCFSGPPFDNCDPFRAIAMNEIPLLDHYEPYSSIKLEGNTDYMMKYD